MNLPVDGNMRRMDSREAADTGLLLWRENFVNFILFFAIPFWLCAFFLRLLPGKAVYFSYLILWWLKPFFDRLILHVISVSFFESGASLRLLCRRLDKNILRGLPGDLLWRRFNPLRSAMTPVRTLEFSGKSKKTRRLTSRLITERKRNLKNGGINYCYLLSLWGITLEAALLIGETLFVIFMLEMFAPYYLDSVLNGPLAGTEIFIYTAYCVNYILIETIYVCMGFSLYINSRIEVEGWDLEIKFRSFAEKYRKQIGTGALLLLFCVMCALFPVKASADEKPYPEIENVPITELQNILSSPDFGGEKDSWGIRFKNQQEKEDDTAADNADFSSLFEKLRLIFANILKFFLIAIIAALAVVLFILSRKMIFKKTSIKKSPAITALRGIRAEDPDILLEKSLEFYKQGELRFAWGYCTASVIISWQLYRGLVFPPNATESDCANMVMRSNSAEGEIFADHIKYWINFVYAGKLPPPESFEKAVCFCKSLRNVNE